MGEERGTVLPLALIILLVLASIVSALLALGAMEPQIAANVLRDSQALNLAEAGADRTIAYLLDPANKQIVDCAMATADDGCPTPTGAATLYAAQPVENTGTYTVAYRPLSFATLLIESTGATRIANIQRTVRVIVSSHFLSRYAMLGTNVDISGNTRIQGTLGAVHANSSTALGGSAYVTLTATSSSGTCTECTNARYVGNAGGGSGAPEQSIPRPNPADYASRATFALNADGTITDRTVSPPLTYGGRAGNPPIAGSKFDGWRMTGSGVWSYSGSSAPGSPADGSYYSPNEVHVQASPGSADSPWRASFIAGTSPDTGVVEIRGHPNIVAFLNDLLIIAADVRLTGTGGDAYLKGTIVATAPTGEAGIEAEEFGGVNLTGNIIAFGDIAARGTNTITYDVPTRTRFIGPLRILSWSTTSH